MKLGAGPLRGRWSPGRRRRRAAVSVMTLVR